MTAPQQEIELRLRCIDLAIRADLGDPLAEAKRFHAFVTGQDAKTPRQLIDEALEAAGVVNAGGGWRLA